MHRKTLPARLSREVLVTRRYWGLYTRVARKLGVSVSHVTRVADGQRQSRRVADAIEREARRMKEEAAA
jgi:hypothetical protein